MKKVKTARTTKPRPPFTSATMLFMLFMLIAPALFSAGCAHRSQQQRRSAASPAAESNNAAQLVQQSQAAQSAQSARSVLVSHEGADSAEPALTSAPDGSLYVAWIEHQPEDRADVWLAHFAPDGRSLISSTRVNPRGGEATAWRGDPPTLAAAPGGTIYVGWTARAGENHATALMLSASRNSGRSFEPPVKVNDDARPCVHGLHSLALGPTGRIYVAWLDERNAAPAHAVEGAMKMHSEQNRELFFAFSDDGGRTFSINRRIAVEVCPCCKTSLAVAPDNRIYVSWRQVLPGSFRHIAVASSSDGGDTFGSPVIVSDDRWALSGCPVSGPALAVAASGIVRVLWYTAGEAGDAGLYWSESRDGARSFGPRQRVTASDVRGTPTLLANENGYLLAVWEGNQDGQVRPTAARLQPTNSDATAAWPSSNSSTHLNDTGELPTAVLTQDRLALAYITRTEGHRIWLLTRPLTG